MKVKTYDIKSIKVPKQVDILQLNDLHAIKSTTNKKFNDILNFASGNQQDYIVFLGDILHDSMEADYRLIPFFKELSRFAKERLLVINGNHDTLTIDREKSKGWKRFVNDDFFKEIKRIDGLSTLNNQTLYFEKHNINFIGLDFDGQDHYEDKHESEEDFIDVVNKNITSPLNNLQYNILLSHSPKNAMNSEVLSQTKLANYIDLILSGHMHNGVIPYWLEPIFDRLFKLAKLSHSENRGLVGPIQGIQLFPEFARGAVDDADFIGIIGAPLTCIADESKLIAKIANSKFVVPPAMTRIIINREDSIRIPVQELKSISQSKGIALQYR